MKQRASGKGFFVQFMNFLKAASHPLAGALVCRRHALCGVAALLIASPGSAGAQTERPGWRLTASRAAVSPPAVESAIQEQEFVHALRQYGEVRRYKEAPAAGLRLSHYTAGLKFDLPLPVRSRWSLIADFGLGATRLRSNELNSYYTTDRRVSETFLSVLGGMTLGYALAPNWEAFVGARQFFYLDEDEVAVDGLEDSGRLLESGSWTFPITFGMKLTLR